jgi:hypothetical protein
MSRLLTLAGVVIAAFAGSAKAQTFLGNYKPAPTNTAAHQRLSDADLRIAGWAYSQFKNVSFRVVSDRLDLNGVDWSVNAGTVKALRDSRLPGLADLVDYAIMQRDLPTNTKILPGNTNRHHGNKNRHHTNSTRHRRIRAPLEQEDDVFIPIVPD